MLKRYLTVVLVGGAHCSLRHNAASSRWFEIIITLKIGTIDYPAILLLKRHQKVLHPCQN